ncbi:MAG: hypothetical protein FWE05_07525 [Defluviitaleaceae bacterium]|nr:hypothetical protein [Defluviitaleaceae bacterium]
MKKMIICLVAVLIAFQSLTVLAVGDNVNETIGTILSIENDKIRVKGEAITDGGQTEIVIHVGDAPIFDLRTGLPVSLQNVSPNMGIRAAYEIVGTDTPAKAVAIWLNPEDEDAAVFTVLVSENIQYGTDGVVFLSVDEKYRVVLNQESQILDYNHAPLTSANIVPGMEFFVWVDMITASCPALVYPDKVVQIY